MVVQHKPAHVGFMLNLLRVHAPIGPLEYDSCIYGRGFGSMVLLLLHTGTGMVQDRVRPGGRLSCWSSNFFPARAFAGRRRCKRRSLAPLSRAVMLLFASVACMGRGVLRAQDVSGCPGGSGPGPGAQSSVAAYDERGVYFAEHGQIPCAIANFEEALKMDPASWETHYDLGLALLSSARNKEAVAHLEEALRATPGKTEILMALGTAFERLGEPEKAVEQYGLVLKANPQSVPALVAMGKALIAERQFHAAIQWLSGSTNERVQRLLAEAYEKNDQRDQAIATLRSLLTHDPSNFEAHVELGTVLQRQGEYAGAAEQFQIAMQMRPDDTYAALSYANTQVVLQQYANARPVARELLRKQPHDFSALYLNGLIERDTGEDAHAEQHLREASALNPDSYEAHYTLGFVLARRGSAQQAAEQMRVALKLRPQSTEAHFQLGKILRSLGQQEEAQKQFAILQQEKQEELRKTLTDDKANQADQALRAGDTARSISLYREAIAGTPNDAHNYYGLALALDQKGELPAEREALEHSIERNADFAPAYNQLGYLDMREGKTSEAEVQFKKSAMVDPQYAEPDNNLGVLYAKLGRKAEAAELFQRATEKNPEYTQAFVNLALVLASQGNFAEADAALRHALRLAPQDASALRARAMLGMHAQP